jgi:hypothetical protein
VKFVGLVTLLAACGPGLAPQDVRDIGLGALVDAAGNADELERLFRDSVVNGGLWFADPVCASQFAQPAEVPHDQLAAFAHCLAELHLQPSNRADALGDVVVMSYAPGIEIEARVAHELYGEHLSWIGFESRRADDPPSATITDATLESLRTSGDANGPLDPSVAATLPLDPTPTSHAQFSWLRICLDETGAVHDVRSVETTSADAAKAFTTVAKTWTFKPFEYQGSAMPVCAMVRAAYPSKQAPKLETLPLPSPNRTNAEPIVFAPGTKSVEAKRIAGNKLIAPDSQTKLAISHSHEWKLTGTFRLCLDEQGSVADVLPVRSTGYASYDRAIISQIHAWQYSPFVVDGKSVPVCTSVTFIYTQH